MTVEPNTNPEGLTRLSGLSFSDLALEAESERCRFKRLADSIDLLPVPESLWADTHALYQHLCGLSKTRARITWPLLGAPSVRLRVQRRDTAYGPVFVARRIDHQIRALSALGIAPVIVKRLQDPQLRAGLVLFAGGPGSGKTTAACALLKDRMERIGGFTWTAENPVEYDIQGAYGKGQCYQEEVAEDADIYRVFSDTLRSAADTFYIGEIREGEAARSACLAAASGMLVVSTIHADDPQQALMKLGILAGFPSVAQSLKALITLKIEHRPGAHGLERVMRTKPFFVVDEAQRIKIRDGNLTALAMDLEKQSNALQMGSKI